MRNSLFPELQPKHSTLMVQAIDGLTVELTPHPEHEYVMSNKEVAHAYGVADSTLRSHVKRHQDELFQGKHYFLGVANSNARSNLPIRRKMWTKAGIIRLGMFIRSERAKQFRDWAERVILEELQSSTPGRRPAVQKNYPRQRKDNRLTPARLLDIMQDVMQIEDKEVRVSITRKLMGKGGENA